MSLTAALLTMALVTQDQTTLRAAPRDSATQQTLLWQGDALEVRGSRMDYLQVYDHRRERAGYVRASQVRAIALDAASAPDLLTVLRFVRDTPGDESLGIAYAAAYLKAAPAGTITAEPFAALGSMAERLARRATQRQGKADSARVAEHLEVAASYGVKIVSFEREGQVQLCYDGEAFRKVLALTATDSQKAVAALALTRPDCINPALPPLQRQALDQWRADTLDRVALRDLPEILKNRVRLRRAGVLATIAHARSRRGEAAIALADRALQDLAAINKAELGDEDLGSYTEAAVRVSASRWAVAPEPTQPNKALGVVTENGEPGQTCVLLVDAQHDRKTPLLRRCTYATVWLASAATNSAGTMLTLAVQPLDTWRELWVFHKTSAGWMADVLPPASSDPGIGYAEFAGWVPGGERMLAVREAKVDGRWQRRFEVLRLDTLTVEKQADAPESLSLFYRWQSPAWKRETLSLR